MIRLNPAVHRSLAAYYSIERRKFLRDLSSVERHQRLLFEKHLRYLQAHPYWSERFRRIRRYEDTAGMDVTDYGAYEASVFGLTPGEIPQDGKWVPTSGSTARRKWFPYTPEFLQDINRAAAAWLGDIYHAYPKVLSGRHYWSLSWLPTELRGTATNDDSELLPGWQRWLFSKTMAANSNIQFAPTSEAAWYAQLVSLVACSDLSLISVWSPTYWLQVGGDIRSRYESLLQTLRTGRWQEFETELAGLVPVPKLPAGLPNRFTSFEDIWPRLSLMSAWDSASSTVWAKALREQHVSAAFQGKGLWATEGVVSIPFEGRKPLSGAHFMEFRCLDSQKILAPWKLQIGQTVQPLLWTRAGLVRYALPDRLEVIDTLLDTPCFEFRGRLQSTDLVGEKISADTAKELLAAVCTELSVTPENVYSVIADRSDLRYLVCVGPVPGEKLKDIGNYSEKFLNAHHHYRLARELRQLKPAAVRRFDSLAQFQRNLTGGPLSGQSKTEPLREISGFPSDIQ